MCSLVVDNPTCSSWAGVNWVMYVKWQLSTWSQDSHVRTRMGLKLYFLVVDRIYFPYKCFLKTWSAEPTSLCVQSSTGSLLRVSISSSFRNKLITKKSHLILNVLKLLSSSYQWIVNRHHKHQKVFGRHLHQLESHQTSLLNNSLWLSDFKLTRPGNDQSQILVW